VVRDAGEDVESQGTKVPLQQGRDLHRDPEGGLEVNKDARPTGIGFRNKASEYDERGYGYDLAPRNSYIRAWTTILTEDNQLKEFQTRDYVKYGFGCDAKKTDPNLHLFWWLDRA
jgi:hypothetical protein